MKKIIHKIGTLFILTALFAACATATITTAHVTQPVMLGKVKNVHGQESNKGQQKMSFDIEIRSTSLPLLAVSDSSIKTDAELLNRIDSPDNEVIVDEVRIGCYSSAQFTGYGLVPYDFCEVAILGGIFSLEKGDQENNEKK